MRTNWTILILSVFFITAAQAKPYTVNEYKLDNGMVVLVKPDHRTPIVSVYTGYKVGGSYEPSGITGISHALEHMMFQGTYTHPGDAFFKITEKNGGNINASTFPDKTVYKINISKDKLPLALELEADRMQNLVLDPKAFAKEMQVVKEERHSRTDNNPRSYTYERFKAAALPGNPYHNPNIGWPSDLDNMTVEDLREWYETWYAPNNAFLVVVGDVNPDDVYQQAKKAFGTIKPSPLPKAKPFAALTPVGEKHITVKRPAKLPYLIMGYNIPTIPSLKNTDTAWEVYALDVIESILDSGDSTRFAKNLVRQQKVAANISATANIYDRLPSLFVISATPTADHSIEQLQQAITQQLNDLKTQPVSPKELQRVKTKIVADKTYQQDSIPGQAALISFLQSIGVGWREYDNYIEQVNAITPQQIQQVAQKYFVPDRLTVAVLDPQPITGDN